MSQPKEPEPIVNCEAFKSLIDGIAATFTEEELSEFEAAFETFDEYMARKYPKTQEDKKDE